MTFWTILVITYGGTLEGNVSYIATPSQDACEEAMDLHYDQLFGDMPDIMLQCIPTDVPTRLVRPKPRPENFHG